VEERLETAKDEAGEERVRNKLCGRTGASGCGGADNGETQAGAKAGTKTAAQAEEDNMQVSRTSHLIWIGWKDITPVGAVFYAVASAQERAGEGGVHTSHDGEVARESKRAAGHGRVLQQLARTDQQHC